MTWWRRLLRQRQLERELDAELRDHIEREVAAGLRGGQAEAEVRREIRLRSGALDQVKEACRDVRRPRVLADLGADLRFALRILATDRWFTATAVLTLALAMGVANTTFILTYATLMRDFPFERPERVAIMRTHDGHHRVGGVSYPDFEDWRRDARVFDGPAAAFTGGTISLGRDGSVPEQFDGLFVSADTFTVLRVKPLLGRDFSAADDRPGAEAVVIIGSNVWKSRYGASPDVLGRKVSVNGTPAAIIGVMPDGFHFVDFTDLWLPLSQMPGSTLQRRDARALFMIGRLPDGTSLDRVRAELRPIAANLSVTYPDTNKDVRPLVDSFYRAYNGGLWLTDSLTLMPLLAAAFVLLIASANLANLLLARAAYRSREISIRIAIGATRWRIVRQLLIESLLLALVAWVLAVGGSWLMLKLSSSITTQAFLPYWRLKMDIRLLGLLAAVALLTTGLFGLGPALHASCRGTADGLKESGRMSAAPKTRRWTHALLVGQFALTLALVNSAGLTAKTLYKVYALDLNVRTSDAVTTFVRLPPQTYATPEQRLAFHQQMRDRLLAVPGITATTVASAAPFSRARNRRLTAVDGRAVSDRPPNVMTVIVEPEYFHAVVRGLILGGTFSELDGTPGHEAAIVNHRFADLYLGAVSPIGRHLELQPPSAQPIPEFTLAVTPSTSAVPVTVIGVSPDVRQGDGDVEPMVYLPFRAEVPADVTLIVRGSGGPARVASAAREAANAIDPDLALGAVRTLDELRDHSRLFSTGMVSQSAKIGGLALVLSGVGLYSAMAYAVRRRTREIAVRMALGAQSTHVRWLFLRTGAWVVAGGLALGAPASLAFGRLMQSTLVGTDARDLVTLIGTIAVLVTVALVASVVPTQRATRLEPTTALRIE
ncbi:MAG TPA: ADOP family duplicated permease [Vicinamibacterales bacterium]|nr:ADOP family duplicated permease [Vicinamibacterales bacterium]